MSYRDRRLAKAERLRDWADKREAKAEAAFEKVDQIAGMIPMGQPILVGHHSEKRHRKDVGRIESGMRTGIESSRMAEDFRRRADGIEAAAERAIYSDDDDAIEKLEARIADLEAERDRIKKFNAAVRKGVRHVEAKDHLSAAQWADYLSLVKVASYQLGKKGEMPGYVLSNLSGNISRNRKRLEQLKRERGTGDGLD